VSQVVQLRHRHPSPAGGGPGELAPEEDGDQPQGQPYLVPGMRARVLIIPPSLISCSDLFVPLALFVLKLMKVQAGNLPAARSSAKNSPSLTKKSLCGNNYNARNVSTNSSTD
jgi:hypothetical protein